MPKIRIQKALAEAGVASRRAVEEMILEGRITVNGDPVASLPCFVDLATDDVRVDSQKVSGRKVSCEYYLLNKPRGVVCTQDDPEGRPRACDLIGDTGKRIYCAGRLDADSTGLVILTNDGDLTERLTHPRYGVAKTYVVEVDGCPDPKHLEKLAGGLYLDGKRAGGAQVKMLRRTPDRSLLEIKLAEGKNRGIRFLLARIGHKVRRLKRVAIGPITDAGLKIGSFRVLRQAEVERLRHGGRT
jgi:23S rRNA pseudouridine2605 synthase